MKSKVLLCAYVVVLSLFVLCAPPLWAQTPSTGALTGTVTDTSGAVIPNATVTATNTGTGQARTVTSGGDGSYQIGLLPPGTYRVKFEAKGFKTVEVPSVTVTVTETNTLSRALEVGSTTEQVVVTANVEAIQTTNATVGSVIGGREVTDLPLTTRNYVNLLSLSAGTSATVANASQIGRGFENVASNGAGITQNNYQMDGASIVNFSGIGMLREAINSTRGPFAVPNPDAIQEFMVQTSQYDAGYGRNPGANVNVATKSGTDAFHGTAFEFFRNTVLNANDWFNKLSEVTSGQPNKRGVLDQNQFGGVFGGPVKKGKLFFFVSYQGTAMKNGVAAFGFSDVLLPNLGNPSGFNAANSRGSQVCSTSNTTIAACEGADGGATGPTANFVNALAAYYAVPANSINPVSLRILQLPSPTPAQSRSAYLFPGLVGTGARGLTAYSIPAIYKEHQGIGNWDYVINSRNTLSGRYLFSQDPTTSAFWNNFSIFPSATLPGFTGIDQFTNHEGVLRLTSILTSNLVNEARVSFQRNSTVQSGTNPADLNDNVVGTIAATPSFDASRLIGLSIAGVDTGTSPFGLTNNVVNQFQFADQISWNHGRQTIRAGAEADMYIWNWNFPSLGVGELTFQTFPQYLEGLIFTNGVLITTRGNLDNHYRAHDFSGFVQDDIKISSRLTVNLGLRWEYNGGISELNGMNTNLWPTLMQANPFPLVSAPCPAFPNPCPGSTLGGYVVPSNFKTSLFGAIPPGVVRSSQKYAMRVGPPLDNFAPRIGFAWQPLASNRLVVRAGFGSFYDRVPGEDYIHSAQESVPYAIAIGQTPPASFAEPMTNPFANTSEPTWVRRWYTAAGLSSNSSVTAMAENFQTPVVYQYNLNVQYEFLPSWVLELGYVGERGVHQFSLGAGSGSLYYSPINPAQLASAANPVNCGYDGNPADCITTDTAANVNLRVHYLGISPSTTAESTNADSKSNSAQATVRKQFAHGLTLQGAYTYSRAFYTQWVGVNSFYPVASVYGRSQDYNPNRFILSYGWDLPFGHAEGLKGKLVQGWTVSGVTTIQQGMPLTVSDGGSGSAFGKPANLGPAHYAPGMGPANVATSASAANPHRVNAYFNTSAFTSPPCITSTGAVDVTCTVAPGEPTGYGNSGLGVILGPGQSNWDIALAKTTVVGGLRENATLQFRAEFFNAFNHPQFSPPGVYPATNDLNDRTAVGFGVISTTSVNPRLIQFALKYAF
jgi:hypothetical protein